MTTVASLVASFGGDISGLLRAQTDANAVLKQIEQNTANVERATKDVTEKMKQHWEGFGASIKRTTEMMVSFVLAQAGIAGVAQIFQTIMQATIGLNAQLETASLQFEMFSKNADWARQHVEHLFDIAKATPFFTAGIIEVSRQLEVFGGTALNTEKNILLIGDAAAKSGAGIERLSFWFTRMYSDLRSGEPITVAVREMEMMGIISGDVAIKINQMQRSGADASEVWKYFKTVMAENEGAMARLQATWAGVTSTFEDTKNIMISRVFRPIFESARDTLGQIDKFLNTEEGDRWTQQMAVNVTIIIAYLKTLIETVVSVGTTFANMIPGVQFTMPNLPSVESVKEQAKEVEEATEDSIGHARAFNNAVLGFDIPATFKSITVEAQSSIATLSGLGGVAPQIMAAAGAADALRAATAGVRQTAVEDSERAKATYFTQQPGFAGTEAADAYATLHDAAKSLEATMVPMEQQIAVAENRLKSMKLAMEPLTMAVREQELAIKQYTQATIVPLQVAVEDAQKAVNLFRYEEIAANAAVRDAQNTIAAMKYEYIDTTRALKDAHEALREYKAEHRDVQYAVEDARNALAQYTEAHRGVGYALQDAQNALKIFEESQLSFKQAVELANNSLERQKVGVENIRIASQPFKDAMDDWAQKIGRVRDMLSDAKEKLDRFMNAPVQGDAAFRAAMGGHEDRIRQLRMQVEQMELYQRPGAAQNPRIVQVEFLIQREEHLKNIDQERHDAERAAGERQLTEINIGATKGPEISMAEKIAGAKSAAAPMWGMEQTARGLTDQWVAAKEAWRAQEDQLLAAERALRTYQAAADKAANTAKEQGLGILGFQQAVEKMQTLNDAMQRGEQPFQRLIDAATDLEAATDRGAQSLQRVVDTAQDAADTIENVVIRPFNEALEDQQEQLRLVNERTFEYKDALAIASAMLDDAQWPVKEMNRAIAEEQLSLAETQLTYDKQSLSVEHMKDAYSAIKDVYGEVTSAISEMLKVGGNAQIFHPYTPEAVSHIRDAAAATKDAADNTEALNAALVTVNPEVAKFALGIAAVAVAFNVGGGIVGFIGGTVAGVLALAGVIGGAIGFVGDLAAGIALLTEAIAGGEGVMAALGLLVAVLGGPVTLIIGAVILVSAALVLAWVNDWGGIQEKTQAVWGVIGPILGWVKDRFVALWDYLNDHLFPIFDTLKDIVFLILGPAFDWVIDKIGHVGDAFSAIGATVERIGKAIDNHVLFSLGPFEVKIGDVKNALGLLATFLKDVLGNSIGNWVYDNITKPLDDLHGGLQKLFDWMKNNQHPPAGPPIPAGYSLTGEGGATISPQARGGDASGWALVGEEGPEIVRLPFGSHVFPNGVLPSFQAGGDIRGSLGYGLSALGTPAPWMRGDSMPPAASAGVPSWFNSPGYAAATELFSGMKELVDTATEMVSQYKPSEWELRSWGRPGTTGYMAPQAPQYWENTSQLGQGGTLVSGKPEEISKAVNSMLPVFAQISRGVSASAPGGSAFSSYEEAPGMFRGRNETGQVQVNTTVNTGVVVGNQKELANVISKENVHSFQQAMQSGQR